MLGLNILGLYVFNMAAAKLKELFDVISSVLT